MVRTPELLVVVLPVALLLALLYALTNHARHHELIAIRSAGMSLLRLAVPYLAVGFVLSLLVFILSELWVPQSVEAAERILTRRLAGPEASAAQTWERKFGFTNYRDRRHWIIQAYNPTTAEMLQPNVIWTLPDGTRHEFSAERAFYRSGTWVFTNAQELIFPPVPGAFPLRRENSIRVMGQLSETPEQIKNQIKISKINSLRAANRTQLSIREILEYKKWHPEKSLRAALLDTKLHGRFAAPWTCLVVVLIALPFGATSARRNVYVGVASSVLITFAFFVLSQLSLALGGRGDLPPVLAAWAPNLIFALTGLYLTWQVR